MPSSLAHRLGLGNDRAVTNAEEEVLRHDREEQLVADLVAALALHGVVKGARDLDDGARAQAEPVSPAA